MDDNSIKEYKPLTEEENTRNDPAMIQRKSLIPENRVLGKPKRNDIKLNNYVTDTKVKPVTMSLDMGTKQVNNLFKDEVARVPPKMSATKAVTSKASAPKMNVIRSIRKLPERVAKKLPDLSKIRSRFMKRNALLERMPNTPEFNKRKNKFIKIQNKLKSKLEEKMALIERLKEMLLRKRAKERVEGNDISEEQELLNIEEQIRVLSLEIESLNELDERLDTADETEMQSLLESDELDEIDGLVDRNIEDQQEIETVMVAKQNDLNEVAKNQDELNKITLKEEDIQRQLRIDPGNYDLNYQLGMLSDLKYGILKKMSDLLNKIQLEDNYLNEKISKLASNNKLFTLTNVMYVIAAASIIYLLASRRYRLAILVIALMAVVITQLN